MKILADRPIAKASEDDLGRLEFAKHLAAGILNWSSKDSLCLAIHGSWGSGKTSIINLCIEEIHKKSRDRPKQERPIVMHFRPWLFSGQQEVLVGTFLAQLRQKLTAARKSDKTKTAAERLAKYEPFFEVVSDVPKVGWLAKLGRHGLRKARGADADLEVTKAGVWKALEELEAPVLIVVDDVDRLTIEEIRQLFQLIKAVADFPRTIYLLAFDDRLVEEALERFQFTGAGARYLEKIVQLDFEIPAPSSDTLTSLLLSGLAELERTVGPDSQEQHRWNQLKFGPLPKVFRNIRDVKRYLNAVSFKFPTVKGEVNSVDLMIVECLRIFAPELYRKVRASEEILPSDSPRAQRREIGNLSRQEVDAWANEFFEASPEWCQDQMKEMLALAFPEVQRITENIGGWGAGFRQQWIKNRRICMSPYFRYYFRESLPEGEVSEEEANEVYRLRTQPEVLNEKLASFFRDGRIGKLLWKLEDRFSQDPDEKTIENLINAVFQAREVKPQEPRRAELPSDWGIDFSVERLLGLLDYEARKRVLESCIVSSEAVVYPVTFVGWLWRVWNPEEGKGNQFKNQDKLFNREDTEQLRSLALTKLRQYAGDQRLHKAQRIGVIFHFWSKWARVEEVRTWVGRVLDNDQNLPDFLRNCGTFVTSRGAGAHYQRHAFTIDPKNLKPYCDLDQLRKKCERILESSPEWLGPEEKAVLEIFLLGFGGGNADEE